MIECVSRNKRICFILNFGGLLWNLKNVNVVDVFFYLGSDVCENCSPKDSFEMSKLKNYLEGENYSNSINSISVDTGISVKNLNRYFENEEFSKISSKLNIGTNIDINL